LVRQFINAFWIFSQFVETKKTEVLKTINIIGAGNVAYFFGYSLHEAGFDVKCICNRTIEKANELAKICGSMATDDIIALPKTDLTVLAVSDDYISEVAEKIFQVHENSLPLIHTSGSLTLDVFHKDTSLFGSIWPLQSILKGENPGRMDVPLCLDANTKNFLDELLVVSKTISDTVIHLPSEKKKYAHVAAVLSNNFTNHLLTLAESYCRDHNIPFEILKNRKSISTRYSNWTWAPYGFENDKRSPQTDRKQEAQKNL
jgi:predicted short-subunit dehydrogenase-like oxidoreductase (DUF2520 family)